MKKNIAIIVSLLLMILPMMSMPTQAVSLEIVQIGTVNNLKSELKGSTVYFTWDGVANAEGYDVYINTANQGYQYIGSVNSNNAPVIGFQQGVNYLAKVCAYKMNSNGTKQVGGFSNEIQVSITPKATLAAVSSLTASQNGGNVSLNWSKVSNATGYQIFVDLPSFGYVNLGSVDGVTSAIITGCQNNTTYRFKVRAYQKASSGELGYGEFSPEKTITINTNQYEDKVEEIKPEKVQGLKVTNISENVVDIRWQISNNARGYEIYLATENGRYQYIDTVYKNSATLKKLDYDTNYKVKVIPFRDGNNGTVYGEESQELRFTTDKQKIEVGTPKNLYVEVDKNKAYLDWSKANNADGYEVWLKGSRGGYQYKQTVYKNSATISNLEYDTTYQVIIVAFKEINGTRQYGEDSSPCKFTTEEEIIVGQVKDVNVEVGSGGTAVAIWSKAKNAEGYEIYLSQKNKSNFKYIGYTTGLVTTLGSLQQNTTYYIKIVPYCYRNGSEKYGKETVTKFVTPKEEAVSKVTGLTTQVEKGKVYLNWNPVQGAAKYEIEFCVPWVGNVMLTEYSTFREVSELTANSRYTVRVRAYKWVDGYLVPGEYSDLKAFIAK